MADDQLFEDLPEQERPQAEVRGVARLRVPERSQIGMQMAALDDLISEDHPVRSVWAFVEGLDLSALHDAIKAREGQPGHPPAAPELMVALWLWATVDGVGSARQLDRLCRDHLVYRWLCGGVSMNYHSLSTFRIAHIAVLERLLAQGVAAMVDAGFITRASASVVEARGSFCLATSFLLVFSRRSRFGLQFLHPLLRRRDPLRALAGATLLCGAPAPIVGFRIRLDLSLDTLARDGLRVRAGAGASSFRRRPRLDELKAAVSDCVLKDVGWRLASRIQHADHIDAGTPGDRCGRHRYQRFGSRPGTTGGARQDKPGMAQTPMRRRKMTVLALRIGVNA